MAIKCHLTWQILTTNGSFDVTFMCAITHQKHFVHFGRSTWSAVDIFNTLHVVTMKSQLENKKLRERVCTAWHAASLRGWACVTSNSSMCADQSQCRSCHDKAIKLHLTQHNLEYVYEKLIINNHDGKGLKKKMFVCPFPTNLKYWKIGIGLSFLFFFLFFFF